MIRQEKESGYREKVAELYDQIENSQTATVQVKEVIDFSDSFVVSLEEQLNFAERIMKVKDEEICGLKKALRDINTRPMTPTSPAPYRYSESSTGETSLVMELQQRLDQAEELISNLSNKNSSLLASLSEHESDLVSVQKDNKCKDLDISIIQREYEAELISMSTNFNDQKAVSSEEISDLVTQVSELEIKLRDLERDNVSLNENVQRIESENSLLRLQVDPSDNPDAEILAYQSTLNLKKQQLDNALQEIELLNENLTSNSDQISALESSLSEERDINVSLQDTINDLKEKCEILEEKHNDYYAEAKVLNQNIDDLRGTLSSKNEHISELKKALRESHEDYHQVLRDGKSASSCSESSHEKSDLLNVLKEMQSSMKELKFSKNTLKSEVEDDLCNFTVEWDNCVEEVKLYTDLLKTQTLIETPGPEAMSSIAQNVKNLRDEYSLVKSNISTILEEDVPSMMSDLKTELDKILEINSEKETEIGFLKGEVKRFKVQGKKCIDKLRKSIKEKDNLILKLSSDSGVPNAKALQEELLTKEKTIQGLEKSLDKLNDELSGFTSRGVTPDNNISLNETMNNSIIQSDDNKQSEELRSKLEQSEDVIKNFISRTNQVLQIERSGEIGVDQFKSATDKLFVKFDESCESEKCLVKILEEQQASNIKSSEKIDGLIEEIAHKNETISQQSEEMTYHEEVVSLKDSQYTSVNEKLQYAQSQVDDLEEKICTKEQMLSELAQKMAELKEQIEDIVAQNFAKDKSLQDDLTLLKEDLAASEESKTVVENRNTELLDSIENLTKELEEKHAIQTRIESERDALQTEFDTLKSGQSGHEGSGWDDESPPAECNECNSKSVTISELADKVTELECCIDTWTSQVAAVAEENESLQRTLSDKSSQLEIMLQECETVQKKFEAKSSECLKYLAMIKKFKMVKQVADQKLIENQLTIKQLSEDINNLSFNTSKLEEITVTEMINETPTLISEHCSSSLLYTENIPGTHNNNIPDKLEPVISLSSPDPSPAQGALSPDPLATSHDLAQQEEDITVLKAEVCELRSANVLLVAQVTQSDSLISELSEQLESAKGLLGESRRECEVKLVELEERILAESQEKLSSQEQDEERGRAEERAKAELLAELREKDDQITELRSQQASYVNTISEMQDEWKEKEKSMVNNLTEAEAVRFLSKSTLKNISEQDQDCQSEVSESSRYSRDTSFMSQSSRSVYQSQAMPDDVETLQAELLKKNKLAFLIKTKSKKLEQKVREAKKECERSKAHEKVKEKVLAVETELGNITAQLRNLSSGKKTDSAPKIDPKYVEEMEHKITILTAVEQKYENLMVELQTQNHARCVAEERSDELLMVTDEMREKIEMLIDELKVKDSLLCDHMGASAQEERQLMAIREQYDGQQGEVQHLRDMNQKMKEALIHMTEESTKIEQTYKSTMHELESDADEFKCENATLNGEIQTLGNELTTCWAKIEDLEAQNESYMKMLEELHLELQQKRAGSADLEDLKSSLIEVHADKESAAVQRDDALRREADLIEQLNHYEGHNHMLSGQIQEIKALYEDSMAAQEVLKEEKKKLRAMLEEMNSKMLSKETDLESHSSKLLALEQAIESLKASNEELQKQISSSEDNQSKLTLELEGELKSLYNENNALTDTINDLQDKVDDTKNKLNVSNSDRNELTQKLDSVHNHLNDVLSEHEGCTLNIEAKLKQCSALQDNVSEYSSTIEALREELNIVMETNSADLEQNEVCIQALQEDVIKLKNDLASKAEIESELETMKSELQSLEQSLAEKSSEIIELQEEKDSLDSQVEELRTARFSSDNQVIELIEKAGGLSGHLEEKEAKICELQEEISSLKSDSTSSDQLTALEAQRSALETEIKALKINETALQEQLTGYETSTSELYTQMNDASYKLEQWCVYNETQQEYIVQLTEQAALNTQQLAEKHDKITALDSEITGHADQLAEKGGQITALNAKIATLQDEMKTLQESSAAQTDAVNKIKAAAKKKIGMLNTEITTLTNQVVELQADNAAYQDATSSLKTKHDEEILSLKVALEQAESEKRDVATQLQAVTAEWNTLVEEKAELSSELEQTRSENKSKIEGLRSEIQSLNDELERIGDSTRVDEVVQDQLAEKEKVLAEKLQFIQDLEVEKVDISKQLENVSTEVTKLQEELAEMNGKIMLSEALLETNQDKHQSLEDIIRSKEDQIKVIKADSEKSNANIARLTAANDTLEANVERLTAANETLEAGISSLHDRMGAADEMMADMSAKLEQWYYYDQTQQATMAELQTQCQGYVEEKAGLSSELEQARSKSLSKIEELQTQCQGYVEQLKKVDEKIAQLSEENEEKFSNNASLTETIAEFNSRLAASEEILSEREKHVAELNIELAKSQCLIFKHEQTCEELKAALTRSNEKTMQNEEILDALQRSKDGLEKKAANLESQLTSTSQQKDDLAAEKSATKLKINFQDVELLKLNDLLEEARSSTKQVIEEKDVITKKAKNVMKAYKDSKLQVEQLKQTMEAQKKSSSEGQGTQLEQLAKENADLNASKVDMEQQNSMLMSEIENFDLEREIMNSLKQEISELKKVIIEKSNQVQSLEGYLTNTTSQNEEQSSKITSLLAELETIKTSQTSEQGQLIEKITDSLQHSQESERKLVEALQSSAELVNKAQLDCIGKDQIISDLSTSIDEKSRLIENLAEDAKTDYNEAISSLQKSKVVEESLSQRLEELSIELDSVKSDSLAKQNEVDHLTSSLQHSESVLEQTSVEIRNLSSEVESLRFHVTSLNERLAVSKSLENDITNFSQSNENASDALQTILGKARRSEELSQAFNNSENEVSELKEKLSFYTRDIEKLITSTEKMSSVENQNYELQRKLETSEMIRNETEQSIELLHHKFEQNFKELAATKASLDSKNKELDDMVSQFHSTINKLAEKEAEINNLKAVLAEKEGTIRKVQDNFDAQIKTFQSTASDDQAQLDYLKKELSLASTEKHSLEEKISEMNNKIHQLVSDNESLTSSLQSKTEDIGSLQEECDKVMRKLDSAEREYEIIEEQASEKDYYIMELQSQLKTAKSVQLAAKTELEQLASSEELAALRDAVANKEKVMLEMNNHALQQYDENNNKVTAQFEDERGQLRSELKEVQNVLEGVRAELMVKSERVDHLDTVIQQHERSIKETEVSRAIEEEKHFMKMTTLECDIANTTAALTRNIEENKALKLSLQTNSSNNEAIKASLDDSAMLKNSLLEVQQKLEDFKTTNSMLEEASLRAEEKSLELLTSYDEKCKELKELKADVSHKGKVLLDKYEERGSEITTLKQELLTRDENILEKEQALLDLHSDFSKLTESNSLLNAKVAEVSQNTSQTVLSEQITSQLNQAISDNTQLTTNNAQLAENNSLLSTNNKQLHESISVFQQRDAMLSDMCQKLQAHSELLTQQIVELNADKAQLVQAQPGSEAITSSLREEVNHLKTSKTKLVSELEQTHSRLSNAALKAESLEKSLYDITSRYNEQCGVVEKRTNDLTKITRQYKHLKRRLVNELNARKTVLQDSISGRDRATVEIGERSKRLQVGRR